MTVIIKPTKTLLLVATNVFLATVSHGFTTQQRVVSSRVKSALSATTEDATDISITVPPYFDSTDTGYPYPSVLHSIHVRSVMTNDEAQTALKLAQSYAASTGRLEQPDSERHSTYATCDFPVEEALELHSYLENDVGLTDTIWEHLNECFGVAHEDMTYLDFFVAQYQDANSGSSTTMDRLEAHRDGSLLSFIISLSPPDEYTGGGTFFEALKTGSGEVGDGVVRPNRAGDAVMHSGKLLHGADVVTEGTRTVIVGFVDVADWCMRSGALSDSCREWGRMDVATRRYQRQVQKSTSLGKNGWCFDNSKWLPKANENLGRSFMQGFSPAFSTVQNRANHSFQRQRRLKAEDLLLRTILLPEDERDEGPLPFSLSDITIM
mmetsp:Transcript_16222/g.21226  ORF Transcript_16222/g.21226 Transcript_16222/m.21226 type:complete len:379 (+) Transcript_16222:77-1213(+)|eukprot:CAMPEP_0198139206 /NCGR_PEP_ID=MMETSP1443-20131203/2558_1 /TAXON_ID=186043 /ORGANISM="Entomoneis sp., Strain CCMP2396" /LENGTH=378 /DNA_ID=CAMNT_0043801277 /DNA_START=9 /DNA_END=1145 /DNA_ORIENTATION=+